VAIIRDAGLALPVTEEQASALASIDPALLADFWRIILEYCEQKEEPVSDRLIKRAVKTFCSSRTSSERPGVEVNLELDA
jgi:hypothetical protein